MEEITGRVLESKEIRSASRLGILLKVEITRDPIQSHIGQIRYVFVPSVLARSPSYLPVLYEFIAPKVFRLLQEQAQSNDLPEGGLKRVYAENARFNRKVTFKGELVESWEGLDIGSQYVLKVSEVPVIENEGDNG